MKDNFRGWKSVFGFTFRQATKGVGFKLVTLLVAFLILGVFVLVNIIVAKPDKVDQVETSPINRVIILDNSGLQPTNFKEINPQLNTQQFGHIDFAWEENTSKDAVIKSAIADSDKTLAVIISAKESGYELEGVIPAGSIITKRHAIELLEQISSAFSTGKLIQSGLTTSQLTSVLKPVVTSYAKIGESISEIAIVIKIVAPMLFGFMLYMMLLLYGQTISKSVSTEKTSKLMETLLTSVHPYALITGKVLAITSMALLQFVTWIAAVFAGLFGGNAVARAFYPEYENTAITAINFLKDNIGETAMTIPAVVLAIIFFCIGFLFYSVLAGLAGCLVSKPEDVASTQTIFMFPVIISFLIVYLAPLMKNEALITISRYIPFTAPFSVPVEVITGTIGLFEGMIALTLLLVFTVFIILLSARIYKGLILYTGQKLSLKTIGNVIKAK
ncbi:ABC transporter permease [Mobilitalea sibirica]|uniref:ABC transporter permease n=1 Tax=Mobilitalea sibirica TaxID=1462919 RepID=A0A8J7HDP8_9FIRM|nr:ABC transporter permease [Mobilitalea sibirica]MBH1942337.1 ABC transporter permease [Mobilitalea sibirica]